MVEVRHHGSEERVVANVLCIDLNPELLRRLADSFPDVSFTSATSDPESYMPAIGKSDVIIASNGFFTAMSCGAIRERAPRLRWIQFTTAGTDKGLKHGLPDLLMITTASGAHTSSVSEHAMTLMLALVRRLNEAAAAQRERRWRREELFPRIATLDGATLLIIGLGSIGREVARKAKVFGMRVVGISRNAAPSAAFDAVWPRERLGEALAMADVVVISASYDAEAHHLLSAEKLARMKRSAILVNVARGAIVDEAALADCLARGRIAGAALDVTEQQPLPSDSPLWTLPNVIVTPHVAGAGGGKVGKLFDIIADNMQRFLSGQELRNTVTRLRSVASVPS